MVLDARTGNRLLLWAIAISLAVHLLIALFLPIWTPAQPSDAQPVEALSFARVIRVEMQRLATATRPVMVPETSHKAKAVSFARHKSELSANRRSPQARPTAVNGPIGPVAAAPRHELARRPAPLFARAPAPASSVTSTQTVAVRQPQPAASVAPHAVDGAGGADRGGVLPLGAAQDPVVDPSVLAQLQKRVNVHVTLLVTVGEDGHTKHIAFQPPLDAQLEREVESILAEASWDAAVCGGGVTCEGVATIKL
jgi:hypothetical protein